MCNRARNHGIMKSPIMREKARELGLEIVEITCGASTPPNPEPLPEQRMYKWAFDLVADKDNWKMPIDAMVDAPQDPEDRELFKKTISRAVVFYAGCVPLIVDLGDKQIGVKAVGYYAAVGA